jgi:hypothetical protein
MKVLDYKTLFFSAMTMGIMVTSLWGSNEGLKGGLPALLVTREVLTEYVDDRLVQLEEIQGLTEKEVQELSFIRENREDLGKLAEFYGMEILKEQSEKSPSPKESSVSEGHREPIEEASKSRPIPAKALQPISKGQAIGATSFKTSEKGETLVKVKPMRKMAEQPAPKGAKESPAEEAAASSDEILSIHETPELLLTVSKPNPSSPSKAYQNDPPASVGITEEEVDQLLGKYIECYSLRDIDRFLSLFSSRAIQNWTFGVDQIREIYSEFFDQSQSLLYHVEDTTIRFYENAVEARAHYRVEQILKDEKKNIWRGRVRWILVRENGDVRIRSLDYTQEESSSRRNRKSTKRKERALRRDTNR